MELEAHCSQEPATGPYPESEESSPRPHTKFLYKSFAYYLPTYAQVS